MRYFLEEISEDKFEELIGVICSKILGMGTVVFTKGRDGAKDGRFSGIANCYPSEQEPWKGEFIIQAKHTTNPIASCSDGEFFSNQSSILNKEIRRLKQLINDGLKIDNYLLFTNRKYTGTVGENALKHLQTKLTINDDEINCAIIGIEKIKEYLRMYPDIPKIFNLGIRYKPLRFFADDIKEVIITFHKYHKKIEIENDSDFMYINKEEKNKLNNLSKDYFDYLKQDSLPYFNEVDNFLKNPINLVFKDYYLDTVRELNSKIIEDRDEYYRFEEIINEIYYKILESDESGKLRQKKRLIYLFLDYMYYNCDIGKKR